MFWNWTKNAIDQNTCKNSSQQIITNMYSNIWIDIFLQGSDEWMPCLLTWNTGHLNYFHSLEKWQPHTAWYAHRLAVKQTLKYMTKSFITVHYINLIYHINNIVMCNSEHFFNMYRSLFKHRDIFNVLNSRYILAAMYK